MSKRKTMAAPKKEGRNQKTQHFTKEYIALGMPDATSGVRAIPAGSNSSRSGRQDVQRVGRAR